MAWNAPHSWLYYVLLLLLVAGVLASVPMGLLYFLKRSGERRANIAYGLLLLGMGLTLLHNILYMTGFYDTFPGLKFLPIYFTLSVPSLLFYHVKLSLYPAYRFQFSDIKHFLLAMGQWAYFWIVFLGPATYKRAIDHYFYNPFFGGLEQALYLGLFLAYIYFAWRYIYQKARHATTHRQRKQVWYLRKLVKGLFVLFGIHAVFVVGDFICYEFFYINLRSVKVYFGLGALSFAALVYWLSLYGFQVLFWGRRVFSYGGRRTG